MSAYSNPEKVEQELRDRQHWCVYRAVPAPTATDPDRKKKEPFRSNQPSAGCASTRPEEWSSYEDAVRAALNPDNKLDGPGWMLFRPYIGADFDHVRNKETGEIETWVLEIIKRLNSYTELSPSGEGLHVYVKGSAPEIDDPKGGLVKVRKNIPNGVGRFEVYARDRYLTVTGHPIDPATGKEAERPAEIRELSDEEVAWLYAEAERKEEQPATPKKSGFTRLQRFHLLSQGRWSELGHPSQSEADLEYCIFLAEAHRGQRDKIDQDFRASKLMREKWQRADYRKSTLDEALAAYSKNGKSKEEVDPSTWRERCRSFGQLKTDPPRWLIRQLIPEKRITIFSGPSYHGKTWLGLDSTHSLVTGRPLLGYFEVPAPVPVFYHVPELPESEVYARLRQFGFQHLPDPELFLCRTMDDGPAWSLSSGEMKLSCQGRVLFFDTLMYFNEAEDANSYTQVKKLAEACHGLLSSGCLGIVALYHPPKYSSKEGADEMTLENYVMGSAGYGGILGSCLGFRCINFDTTRVYIQQLKAPGKLVKPFQYEGFEEDGHLHLKVPPSPSSPYLRDVLRELNGGDPQEALLRQCIREKLGVNESERRLQEKFNKKAWSHGKVSQKYREWQPEEDPQLQIPEGEQPL